MNIRTKSCCCSVNKDNSTNIYSFEVGAQGGKTLKLSELKGKVLLIVNTASRCGFTPQYAELEQLYKSYHENGFEILDFPCNQFGGQSPEDDAERTTFCQLNYGTTFPQLKKIEVNGDNASPLYKWLKAERGFDGFDEGHPLSEKLDEILRAADPDYAQKPDIKWNFTKFLIDRNGKVVARFEPTADMKRVEKAIEKLL
ncbi:MAG: glutathione peroxidase [Alistipes sp.]|jgi:glutathione peroxidase|nr:glutathione peroxidase [Alistipes sp.]